MTAARDVFRAAGMPAQDGCEDTAAACVVCAREWPRTALYKRWQGASFTDQNKLYGHGLSDRICEPCIYAHSWTAPPGYPPAEDGKRGVNLRLFTHLYDERGYVYANKGSKPLIRDWLRAPKVGAWWAAIADSGQKHVLPWTRVNAPRHRGAGVVRLEQRDVEIGDWALVDVMTAALTAGVTKADIETGQYTARSWQLAEELVRRLEREHGHARGGGWWELALWLSQRDEVAAAERMALEKETRDARRAKSGRSAGRSGGAAHGSASRVSVVRGQPVEALGSVAGPTRSSDENERQRDAASDGVPQRAGPRRAQLSLFSRDDSAGRCDGR
jgi:hypothetical protein